MTCATTLLLVTAAAALASEPAPPPGLEPSGPARLARTQPAPDPRDGPGCYADCNGDHQLDVNDFICFQGWFATCCRADCNHDSALNVLDFVCFMQAFAAGCSDL